MNPLAQDRRIYVHMDDNNIDEFTKHNTSNENGTCDTVFRFSVLNKEQ
jgi:hypothetical protein